MKRIVGIVALALVFLTACNPVIVGDSISWAIEMHGGYGRMPAHSTDGDPGRGVFRNGLTTGVNGVNSIPAALAKLDPGAWLVIQLGTNDLQDFPTTFIDDVRDVMSRIPTNVCVAWVTPFNGSTPTNVNRSSTYRNYLAQHITDFGHACTRMIDWFVVALAHPEYLSSDAVHLSPLGEYRYAELIDASI